MTANPAKMYFRTLGNSGMTASVLSFGFWATFGVKDGMHEREGIDAAKKLMKVARDGGVNLFDNAEAWKSNRRSGTNFWRCLL